MSLQCSGVNYQQTLRLRGVSTSQTNPIQEGTSKNLRATTFDGRIVSHLSSGNLPKNACIQTPSQSNVSRFGGPILPEIERKAIEILYDKLQDITDKERQKVVNSLHPETIQSKLEILLLMQYIQNNPGVLAEQIELRKAGQKRAEFSQSAVFPGNVQQTPNSPQLSSQNNNVANNANNLEEESQLFKDMPLVQPYVDKRRSFGRKNYSILQEKCDDLGLPYNITKYSKTKNNLRRALAHLKSHKAEKFCGLLMKNAGRAIGDSGRNFVDFVRQKILKEVDTSVLYGEDSKEWLRTGGIDIETEEELLEQYMDKSGLEDAKQIPSIFKVAHSFQNKGDDVNEIQARTIGSAAITFAQILKYVPKGKDKYGLGGLVESGSKEHYKTYRKLYEKLILNPFKTKEKAEGFRIGSVVSRTNTLGFVKELKDLDLAYVTAKVSKDSFGIASRDSLKEAIDSAMQTERGSILIDVSDELSEDIASGERLMQEHLATLRKQQGCYPNTITLQYQHNLESSTATMFFDEVSQQWWYQDSDGDLNALGYTTEEAMENFKELLADDQDDDDEKFPCRIMSIGMRRIGKQGVSVARQGVEGNFVATGKYLTRHDEDGGYTVCETSKDLKGKSVVTTKYKLDEKREVLFVEKYNMKGELIEVRKTTDDEDKEEVIEYNSQTGLVVETRKEKTRSYPDLVGACSAVDKLDGLINTLNDDDDDDSDSS